VGGGIPIRLSSVEIISSLCMLPVAMSRSFSEGVAIRYVLPRLLTSTSRFHIMIPLRVMLIPKRR